VYLGEAVPADSIVSPGNRDWHIHAPFPAYDPAAARRALRMAGLSDVNGGGFHDHAGAAARFTLLTQAGNTSLERGAVVIRDSLAAVGVKADIVALETAALVDRIMGGDYDVAYFGLVTTDSDPALNLDFWLSSGGAHVWNPEQRLPATSWESDVDRLMNAMATAQDPATRHALFADVQRIIAQQVPVLCFAFPRQRIALASRIAGATPTAFRPPVLWNAAALRLRTSQ
jgi:peptide/nickel transport system substrate-binding protein